MQCDLMEVMRSMLATLSLYSPRLTGCDDLISQLMVGEKRSKFGQDCKHLVDWNMRIYRAIDCQEDC